MSGRTRLVRWVHRRELDAGRLGVVDGLRRVVAEVRRTHPAVQGRELCGIAILRAAERVRVTLDFAP